MSQQNYNRSKYDLEERLITFAVLIMDLVGKLPNTYMVNTLATNY